MDKGLIKTRRRTIALLPPHHRQQYKYLTYFNDAGNDCSAEDLYAYNVRDERPTETAATNDVDDACGFCYNILCPAFGLGVVLVSQYSINDGASIPYKEIAGNGNIETTMENKIGATIEAEGKSTKEAIDTALKRLGVGKDRVKVQVLSEERKGLFGMKGASQAKVRITIVK